MIKPRVQISLVAARARNGVLGRDGALPWRLKTDLAHFKAVTMGKPMVMGRKTWDGLGWPLPGRNSLVVSRDLHFFAAGAWIFSTIEAALAAAGAMSENSCAPEVCIIGGGQIFAATLPLADILHLTDVDADVQGDTFFPEISMKDFAEVSRRLIPAGPQDDHACVIRELRRRRPEA